MSMISSKKIAVIDVFCGVGGLTHGFVTEGVKVIAGIDVDEACQYPYEHNNGAIFLNKDIGSLEATTIMDLFGNASVKILVGCAPCQPFSTYNNGDRKKDDKWRLLYRFSELISKIQPDIFSMENVPALKCFDNGRVLHDFVLSLEKIGYHVSENVVYCPDYGIPQHRKRLVVLGSKHGQIELIPPICKTKSYKTVRDTIKYLPPITAGEVCDLDPLHRAARLSEKNLERIRESKPGGSWRDWKSNLVAKCHQKNTGSTFGSVYGRMNWDEPAPTITTLCFGYGNGRFGHPEQDRAISLREAALLQTFPFDYQFVKPGEKYITKVIGRQIGNAVPVDLGRVIAKSIKKHIKKFR